MTENEALRYMVSYKMGRGCKPQYPDAVLDEAFSTTITALKEIQQYRKFGTLEEFYKAKKYIDLAKNHGTIGEVIDECAEYEAIGTVEECRAAVERQNPKKPKEILRHRGGFEMHHCPNCDTHYQTDNRYTIKDNYCPVCRKLLDSAFRNYCGNCGQAIAENLEGMEDEQL